MRHGKFYQLLAKVTRFCNTDRCLVPAMDQVMYELGFPVSCLNGPIPSYQVTTLPASVLDVDPLPHTHTEQGGQQELKGNYVWTSMNEKSGADKAL